MKKIEDIREALRKVQSAKQARKDNGRLGEIIVEIWLRQACQADFVSLPQGKGTRLNLLPRGGKRPDFVVEIEGSVFFVDAKLHDTDGLRRFSLDQDEINDFHLAMEQFDISVLFIALLPRDAVDRLYLIELREVAEANNHGAAGIFNLCRDDSQRLLGPVSKEAYDKAVSQYRAEGYQGEVPEYCNTFN